MQMMLHRKGVAPRIQSMCLALWLFSPFTVSISTRGNGEALVTCMLLAMMLLLEQGSLVPAGALFGLAVHWRIYPIVYSLPIMRHLALYGKNYVDGRVVLKKSKIGWQWRSQREQQSDSSTQDPRRSHYSNSTVAAPPKHTRRFLVLNLLSWDGLQFAVSSALVFLGLGVVLYFLYGEQFLHETYIYHASRVDPRHNFSPYFYPAYLYTDHPSDHYHNRYYSGVLYYIGDSGAAFGLAALVVQACLGWTFMSDLPMCFLLQTIAFVAFNKVATAQYFVWHMSWLPLVLPDLLKAKNTVRYPGVS